LVNGLGFSSLFCAATAELALKRKLSFPVSRIWQRLDQALEQNGHHLGVAEDRGPFAEAEVVGNDDAGALIELAQQMEGKRPVKLPLRFPTNT